MKKLHLVALTLLLIGQMIVGPIGIVSASTGVVSPDASLTQACNGATTGDTAQVVTSGDTAGVGGGSSTNPCGKAPFMSLMANLPTVDPAVIHTITTTTNLKDPSYRPTMGEEIELRIDFSLPNQHDYGEGSTLSYPLPEPLKAVSGAGDLIENRNGNIVKYGEFKIDNGQVVINLNDDSRAQIAGGGSMGLPIDGYFQVKAKYELIDKKLDQDLTLPNNGVDETIQLNFKPVGGKKVEKEVVGVDNGGKNSQFVEWKVTVNTLMDDLGTGMPFSDTLTGKHTYDPMSLEVWQETLDADGAVLTSQDVTPSFLPSPALIDGSTNFDLNLTGKHAYTIKYKTIPSDTDEPSEKLENTASFNGAPDSKSTTIQYGSPLTKSVQQSGTNGNAKWTIKVNENRRTLQTGTKITDTWKTNADKHELVGSIEVIPQTLIQGTHYRLNHSTEGFEIELLQPVSDEFTITYTTKPKDLVTGPIPLTNEVVRSDRSTKIESKTASYNQQVLTKTNSNINYQNKTVDWKIVLNEAGYTMNNIVLDDDFLNNNLKIVPNTFKVKMNGVDLAHTVTPKDGNAAGDAKGGFTLNIPGPISAPITITYTTDYDVRGATNLDTYANVGNLQWETGGTIYNVDDVKSTVRINDQQVDKGYKTGQYNYEKKKFEWSVGINYNFDAISNAVFTDTLSASQEVDRNSIKVYPLDLTSGGNGTIGNVTLAEGADYTLHINTSSTSKHIHYHVRESN